MSKNEDMVLQRIIDRLPDMSDKAREAREIILANLAMLGETPAPTFKEERRIKFLVDRFTEMGLVNASVDEVGNGLGLIEGSTGERTILLVAHADTVVNEKVDHTYTINPTEVIGPGVADNSLGLAVLASLPYIFEKINFKPEANILLLGGTRSLGRGNLEGLRFFLSNSAMNIDAGLCIEGVELGRLSHTSIGMLRGDIKCNIPEAYDWSRFGSASAVLTVNEIINKINDIRLPKRPRCSIVLGSIKGGTSYNNIARKAELKFEIRAESLEMVKEVENQIEEIVSQVSSSTGDTVELDIFASRHPGGINFTHPLVRSSRKIIQSLGLEPRLAPSTSELAAFIDHKIPAITLGVSHGNRLDENMESIEIEPIFKGVAQLISTIEAIDGGCCE